MLRAYSYRSDEVGLAEWPSGTLRLAGTEPVTDPKAADVFICPGPLMLFKNPTDLDRFPYMRGNEERHVFFDCSDFDTLYSQKNCIFIRCNLKRHMLDAHPNSISWPWPVEDFSECIPVPEGGFKYDVSFHGWVTSHTSRQLSSDSCLSSGLNCDIAQYKDFTGYIYHEPEGVRRRAEFRRSMKESRVALCPESISGVFPYRFFEAMSAGRVPVLVGSDYVLPFADEIPWSKFIVQIPRTEAGNAGQIIRKFLSKTPDVDLIFRGQTAREYWEKYLDRDKWPELMAYAVEKKLRELAAAV